jgi:predicted GNAT family acetyltransferase
MTVVNHEAQHRFEVNEDGKIAFLKYGQRAGEIVVIHTEVPHELEGRGIGGKLAKAALDYARAQNLKVTALCPFVADYIKRHPEYSDLLRES